MYECITITGENTWENCWLILAHGMWSLLSLRLNCLLLNTSAPAPALHLFLLKNSLTRWRKCWLKQTRKLTCVWKPRVSSPDSLHLLRLRRLRLEWSLDTELSDLFRVLVRWELAQHGRVLGTFAPLLGVSVAGYERLHAEGKSRSLSFALLHHSNTLCESELSLQVRETDTLSPLTHQQPVTPDCLTARSNSDFLNNNSVWSAARS